MFKHSMNDFIRVKPLSLHPHFLKGFNNASVQIFTVQPDQREHNYWHAHTHPEPPKPPEKEQVNSR